MFMNSIGCSTMVSYCYFNPGTKMEGISLLNPKKKAYVLFVNLEGAHAIVDGVARGSGAGAK